MILFATFIQHIDGFVAERGGRLVERLRVIVKGIVGAVVYKEARLRADPQALLFVFGDYAHGVGFYGVGSRPGYHGLKSNRCERS